MFIPPEAQRGKGTSPRKHVDGGVGIWNWSPLPGHHTILCFALEC